MEDGEESVLEKWAADVVSESSSAEGKGGVCCVGLGYCLGGIISGGYLPWFGKGHSTRGGREVNIPRPNSPTQ